MATNSNSSLGEVRITQISYPGPTWHGFIHDSLDALWIVEACLNGTIPQCTRRPRPEERGIIRGGAVFVYEERTSGIKRWTDGLSWTPSRAIGDFLVYRELGSPYSHTPKDGSNLYKKTIGISYGADLFRVVAYFNCVPTPAEQLRPIHDPNLNTHPRLELSVKRGRHNSPNPFVDDAWAQLFDTGGPALPTIDPPSHSGNSTSLGACDAQQQHRRQSSASTSTAVALLAQEIGLPLDYVQRMIDAWHLTEQDGRFSLDSDPLSQSILF
ncbi:gti1 pac2 family protein [Diplodia corticola]|uniref:Gti1 pac2 family protein n=1 Tax=Diplodia corticola TaxID=236234 RepID=A0A1J9RVT1_9PEZI|nr:gti1 pac2 family protein [Diplodia corticola]OJD32479.1 gti1 pac2 family protein [Diplodia corticola]